MKANELRIGNYVYDTLGKVNKIDLEAITYIVKELHNQVKPIPLTEEWLFNFGFEIGYNQKKMLDVYCKDFGLLIERSNSNNFYYKNVNIHSVHQLQNLYFALTGIELTFKSE
jgi:hypothetical protein